MAEHAATVDGVTFALLSAVAREAERLGIRWMVTGASARVLLLESVYGLPRGRATEDLDFVVMVESWDHYEQLRTEICKNPEFTRDPKQAQRIRYRSDLYIDLVPFGGVESEPSRIAWPPDGDFVMSVAGVREVFDAAIPVRVNGSITAPVGSPTGLLLLKLLAWGEREKTRPSRDSADIAYFLRQAEALISTDKLFADHFEVVAQLDYDLPLAACFVLGNGIRTLASELTRERLRALLAPMQAEGVDAPLVRDVAACMPGTDPERILQLLQQLNAGFETEIQ